MVVGYVFQPMEFNNKKLGSLIERAWALHDRLNHEIDDSISFCGYCSDHGRYCDIGQTPFLERKRLIAIRDSLNQVENTLLHLQVIYFLSSLLFPNTLCSTRFDPNIKIACPNLNNFRSDIGSQYLIPLIINNSDYLFQKLFFLGSVLNGIMKSCYLLIDNLN